jgi:hypothetical protein
MYTCNKDNPDRDLVAAVNLSEAPQYHGSIPIRKSVGIMEGK